MNRRKAIKQLGLGIPASLLLPSIWGGCSKYDFVPDTNYKGNVLIIGAGAAGLYAADILRAKNIPVTVLEASSQAGGRVCSLRNQKKEEYQAFDKATQADFPIELGADILFGSNSSWGKIISNLKIATVVLNPESFRYILGNIVKSAVDWQGDADFIAVQNFLKSLPNNTVSGSVKSVANLSLRAVELLNAQAGNFYGSSIDTIDAGALAESLKLRKHNTDMLVSKSNPWQDVLLSQFSESLPHVKFDTKIIQVDWGEDTITVTDTKGEKYTGNKLIVTVPLSILKNGSIKFNPALPVSNTSAMSSFDMSAGIRVLMDFRNNFWGTNSSFIWGGTTAPQYFNSGIGRSSLNRTLSISIYGDKAQQLSTFSDYDKTLKILAELDTIYNGEATKYIRRDLNNTNNTSNIISIVKDWSKEPLALGAFSYPLAGATNDLRRAMAAPADDKLFFAGEAFDFLGDSGTVSGALNSAERVANEVIRSILK